jgi:hypothetical protein
MRDIGPLDQILRPNGTGLRAAREVHVRREPASGQKG